MVGAKDMEMEMEMEMGLTKVGDKSISSVFKTGGDSSARTGQDQKLSGF